MSPPIRMRIIYNVKNHHAICLKFRGTSLNYLTKLMLEVKNSICSTIKNYFDIVASFSHFLTLS